MEIGGGGVVMRGRFSSDQRPSRGGDSRENGAGGCLCIFNCSLYIFSCPVAVSPLSSMQSGIQLEEEEDIDTDSVRSSSSGEDEAMREFLEDIDPEADDLTEDDIKTAQEKQDTKRLGKAFMKLARAAESQAKAYRSIREILARNPSLVKMADLMGPLLPAKPTAAEASLGPAPVPLVNTLASGLLGQVWDPARHPIPKKVGKQYRCRFCDECVSSNYNTVDSHQRQVHTKIFYGPCTVEGCNFTTANKRSYTIHFTACVEKMRAKQGKRKSDEGEEKGAKKKRRVEVTSADSD